MNNELQVFTNSEFGEIRTIIRDGEILFVANDVCKALGIINKHDAISFLDDDEKSGVGITDPHGRVQETNCINESGFYKIVLKSRKPNAKQFTRWVTHDVLPSIRKHGAYILPELLEEIQHNTERNAKLIAELAKEQKEKFVLSSKYEELKVENKCLCERIETFKKNEEKLTQTVNETKPKATYYDLIMSNTRAVPITLIAKDYGMDAVSMNRLLHSEGIQFQVGGTWALYSKYQNKGYTHNNVTELRTGRHVSHMCWTQAGRLFLYNYLKKIDILPQIEKEA